jgi:phosphohistidine phosphatase
MPEIVFAIATPQRRLRGKLIGMVRLYLVRHAAAEELPEGMRFADPQRALTVRGRRRFRRSARIFARLDEEVGLILASPLLRSVQTAELLASALRKDEVRVLDKLLPEAEVPMLLERLSALAETSVALVSHKRLLCKLAVVLAGVPLEDATRLQLKHGAIARIDVRTLSAGASGKPRWWLGPAAESIQSGLPLLDACT